MNRSDLVNHFSISVPQASVDFARYRELAPENVVYDVVQKAYAAAPGFRPIFSGASPDSYLTRLWGLTAGTIEPKDSFLGWVPPVAIVRDPARRVDAGVLREFLVAVREKRRVRMEYQSMSSSTSSSRIISPHAFGFDGARWHVRAYCHNHEDFRDFSLGRVRTATREQFTDVDAGDDEGWRVFVEVTIVPHPDLPDSQRRAVEDDYCMEHGKLILRVREALLFYHLEHLSLLSNERPSKFLKLADRSSLELFFAKHSIRL
ncbi:MAG: WYL domain-containing protein [Acidobacteriota bacterium]|nr:WYL domain-containing protein [Acidobacteriota bacterium]